MTDIIGSIADMLTPEMLPLVAVLYFIGLALKNAGSVQDKHIPLLLGIISIVCNALYILSTQDIVGVQGVTGAILAAFIQGVLFAGASVYANQIWKQETSDG